MAQWQHRSELFSNLSAFNLRSASKRKIPPAKPDIGPLCEKVDSIDNSTTSNDVGSLAKPQRVTLCLPDEGHPRFNVALPCPDTINAEDDGQIEPRQSLFDLSDDDSDLAADGEEDFHDDEEDDDEDDLFDDEIVRTPLPSIDENDENEVAVSVQSRTGKDSLRASLLRRTSSHSAALRPVRSRGESIGLEHCSKDPMVLAAGYEKKLRSRGLTMNDASNRRECFVYRSRGYAGRESWEICPGREALSGQRGAQWKGRSRGETM